MPLPRPDLVRFTGARRDVGRIGTPLETTQPGAAAREGDRSE